MAQPLLRPAGVLEDEYGLHLLVLDALCLSHIGFRYIGWDSDALKEELQEDFGEIGPVTWERIQSARLLHANDSYWKEWEVFENVTAAIAGEYPIFSYAQPPEAEEIAISLVAAQQIANHEFSTDVRGYIAAALLTDGLWYLEDPLAIVNEALLDHDRRKGIDRALGVVAQQLQEVDSYIKEPETAIDIQVNHVIAVRKAVEAFADEISTQLEKLPSILRSKK